MTPSGVVNVRRLMLKSQRSHDTKHGNIKRNTKTKLVLNVNTGLVRFHGFGSFSVSSSVTS